MRSLRLLVFCAALALLTGSVTTAAVRADGPDAVSKTDKPNRDKGSKPGHGNGRDKDKDRKDKEPKDGKDAETNDAKDGTPDGTSPKGDDKAKGDDKDKSGVQGFEPAVAVPAKPADPAAIELPAEPVMGETLGAKPGKGEVEVKLPGADEFTTLDSTEMIPMGSTVDATDGLVEIVVQSDEAGTRQAAVVTGSQFQVTQTTPTLTAPAYTDFTMRGGDFSYCMDSRNRARGDGPTARAAGKRRTSGGVARGLWSSAKGRFRTRGRHSAATVRGTRWAIVDRCKSTTVKVFEGVVDVEDFDLGKVFTLRAGDRLVSH